MRWSYAAVQLTFYADQDRKSPPSLFDPPKHPSVSDDHTLDLSRFLKIHKQTENHSCPFPSPHVALDQQSRPGREGTDESHHFTCLSLGFCPFPTSVLLGLILPSFCFPLFIILRPPPNRGPDWFSSGGTVTA